MVPKRERPPRLSGGGLDDPKAKEDPSPQRRGARWSQNERGPLASTLLHTNNMQHPPAHNIM